MTNRKKHMKKEIASTIEVVNIPTPRVCPICQAHFMQRRKDAQFCSRSCQKNSARGPRTIRESPAERRRNSDHYSRTMELAAHLYGLPPHERLGFMKQLVDAARSHDSQLRSSFTDPKLLRAGRKEPWWFYRRSPRVYLTISQAAHSYCKKFLNAGIRHVLSPKFQEPETGEV